MSVTHRIRTERHTHGVSNWIKKNMLDPNPNPNGSSFFHCSGSAS